MTVNELKTRLILFRKKFTFNKDKLKALDNRLMEISFITAANPAGEENVLIYLNKKLSKVDLVLAFIPRLLFIVVSLVTIINHLIIDN